MISYNNVPKSVPKTFLKTFQKIVLRMLIQRDSFLKFLNLCIYLKLCKKRVCICFLYRKAFGVIFFRNFRNTVRGCKKFLGTTLGTNKEQFREQVKANLEESIKELDRLNKVYSHDFSLETEKTFNSYVPCSS